MGNKLGTSDVYNPEDGNEYQKYLGTILANASYNSASQDNLKRACCLSMNGGSINNNLKVKLIGFDGKVYYKKLRFYEGQKTIEEEKAMCLLKDKDQTVSFYPGAYDNKDYDPRARAACSVYYKDFCESQVKINSQQYPAPNKPTQISNFMIKSKESPASNWDAWKIKPEGGSDISLKRLSKDDVYQNMDDCNCINSPFGDYYIPTDNQEAAHPQVFDNAVCNVASSYKLEKWDKIPSMQICKQAINIDKSVIGEANFDKINFSCNLSSDQNGNFPIDLTSPGGGVVDDIAAKTGATPAQVKAGAGIGAGVLALAVILL